MIRELQWYSGNQTAQWLILLDLSDSTLHTYLHKAPKLTLKKIQPRERTAIKTNCSRCDETSDSHKWQTHEYTCAQCPRFTTKASQNFPSHRLISPAAIVMCPWKQRKKDQGHPWDLSPSLLHPQEQWRCDGASLSCAWELILSCPASTSAIWRTLRKLDVQRMEFCHLNKIKPSYPSANPALKITKHQ